MASDYLSNFYAVAKQLTIPPKTILLEEGKVADKLYLIRKGCLRLFFYNDGKDITFQFFFEGDFVASFDSLYKRTPSLFYLESIEPAEVAAIKRNDFTPLSKTTHGGGKRMKKNSSTGFTPISNYSCRG